MRKCRALLAAEPEALDVAEDCPSLPATALPGHLFPLFAAGDCRKARQSPGAAPGLGLQSLIPPLGRATGQYRRFCAAAR